MQKRTATPSLQAENEGFITHFVRNVFKLFSRFTLMFVFSAMSDKYRSRGDINISDAENKDFARRRMFLIDVYICVWLLLELILIVITISFDVNTFYKFVVCFVASNRITEIFQVLVNVALFDARALTVPIVASRERIVVLAVLNYIELIVLFGIIYAQNTNLLNPEHSKPMDGFYLSAITHFTIGFGDIVPTGHLRMVVALQGFCSTFFIILIFARFMAMFTTTRVLSDEPDVD